MFKELQDVLRDVEFVFVGSGDLESKLKEKVDSLLVQKVHFLGQLEPRDIPGILNCIDVLILPSMNEGLPRIALEAQACGVHVVGSNRGGIPEAIGEENCFDLDKNFVSAVSEKVVYLLKTSTKEVALPNCFSWEQALAHEKNIHSDIADF